MTTPERGSERMTAEMIGGFMAMLRASGASDGVQSAVRQILENDGMVTTGAACRVMGVHRRTLRRMCEAQGLRRVSRRGRVGALVDLPALLAAGGYQGYAAAGGAGK